MIQEVKIAVCTLSTKRPNLQITAKSFVVGAIKLYQRITPQFIRMSCRFDPSCSNYALLAIEKHGIWRGSVKAIGRIVRCRPPNGGVDYP